jgi:hypothetical protein
LEDLPEVAVVRELRRKGFSFERMREVVAVPQERVPETFGGDRERFLELSSAHRRPRALSRNLEARDRRFAEKFPQPMFVVCLSDTVREVKDLVGGGKRPGRWRPEKARSMRKAKSS